MARAAFAVALIGAFLIVAVLVWQMKRNTVPPPLDAARAAERAKALAEIHADEAQKLNNVGWVDPTKGIVRLPIADAMNLLEVEWKNPAAGRSNLLERVDHANPPPPPPKPAAPSPFE